MTGAPFPYGETVTRLRAAAVTDPYSGEATNLDWDNADELHIDGCAFNPGTSAESLESARNAVITRPEVYAPSDADVLAGDRLVVRGRTYDVQGDPGEYVSPFTGWAPGLVVGLQAVEG